MCSAATAGHPGTQGTGTHRSWGDLPAGRDTDRRRLQGSGLFIAKREIQKRTVTHSGPPPGLQLGDRQGTPAQAAGSRLPPGTELEPGVNHNSGAGDPQCPRAAPPGLSPGWPEGSAAWGALMGGAWHRVGLPGPSQTQRPPVKPVLLRSAACLTRWGAEVPNCSGALQRLQRGGGLAMQPSGMGAGSLPSVQAGNSATHLGFAGTARCGGVQAVAPAGLSCVVLGQLLRAGRLVPGLVQPWGGLSLGAVLQG